jgi:hypothetical protein
MLSSRAARVAVGVALPVVALMLTSASPASALPTRPCNQKGTSGDDVLEVTVPAGQYWVVCAGGGNDTVNINAIGSDGLDTGLYIAFGNGNKVINWKVLGSRWNPWAQQAVVVRPTFPDASVTVNNVSNDNGWLFRCGTNTQYKASTNGVDVFTKWFRPLYNAGVSGSCN